ncbi:GNAT family N-acetyltransferase [Pseudoalteromonas luteoviolacea]|uniref:GNAT family N-acetyltransferase n=1 Tax=Pseudoalteromonas luteoviolacea TaxID=43657 RepID=UPI00068D77EB|nr:GNAT family N-acetyltransferase [Pseudoalteromonas luteoviolacea]
MSVTIIPATKTHHPQLLSMFVAHAHHEQHTLHIDDQLQTMGALDTLPVELFIIELKHTTIGYFSVIPQFSTWDMKEYLYLDCLFFQDTYRGMGIGQSVMGYIFDLAKRRGYQQVQWQTPHTNQSAIKFYIAQGAKPKAKQRFFYAINE